MRPLVVETLLTYLELAGVIEATEPFYNEYQFTLHKPSLKFLTRLILRVRNSPRDLCHRHKAEKWFSLT